MNWGWYAMMPRIITSAFSKVFIDDKSVYLQERRFKFIDRNISLREYSDLFRKVFGKNAEFGLCFWLAAVFRDYVLFAFKNFPILNLFGPKGTGKSQMAVSLCSLFGESQIPFNIHNGTKPGLAEHVQQFSNAFAWIDEYKNNLEFDKIETLKSLFDSIGRNRLNTDRRKETTQVNAATILSGQEMPTSDVALFSRLIFLQFNQAEFSQEEKHNYDRLKEMERDGLSHLTNQLIMHRDYFVKNFYDNYDSVLSEVYSILIHDGIEDRILRNWCTLAACLKTLEDRIDLGFSYQSLKPKLVESIRHQNIQVHTSDEIAAFWNIFEALYDENLLIEGWHFRIDLMDTIKQNKGERQLAEPCDILRFKYNALYMLYSERSRRMGAKPLPADTLRYYLENYRFFEGVFSSTKFYLKEFKDGQMVEQKQITSAYCFRYDKIGINLRRTLATADDAPAACNSNLNGGTLVPEPAEMSHAPADEDLPF
jgi:DNA primase